MAEQEERKHRCAPSMNYGQNIIKEKRISFFTKENI